MHLIQLSDCAVVVNHIQVIKKVEENDCYAVKLWTGQDLHNVTIPCKDALDMHKTYNDIISFMNKL